MTKEELEKEAEEKYSKVDREFIDCQDEGEVFNIGYILGAEPREKQIAELSKHIVELQKDKGELTDRIKELEKENAELKNKIRFMGEQIDNLKAIVKYDQLTKAKELLERLLITSCNSDVLNLLPNCSEVLRVRVEAEQFLKET